jgi:RecB family exonuclease
MKKIPKGVSEAEAFGAAVHNTLKKWGEIEEKREERKEEREQGQLEMFAEKMVAQSSELTAQSLVNLWHQSCPTNAYATRFEADAARMRGEQLMELFYTWWSAQKREVVAVEKGFSVEMQNADSALKKIVLTGRFDRIERISEGLHVIDFKTSLPRSQDEVDADLQLSIYALALQQDFSELPVALSLLHLTEDGIVEMRTHRSEGQVRDAIKQITAFHQRMEDKDFHPTPSLAVCKWCPYRGVCDVAAV